MVSKMKVLKIKAYQETANYKKPFMLQLNETYPLPPYSTIIGWLHSILNAKKYIDMNISVQGNYDSIYENLQIMRFYKPNMNTTKPVWRHELYGVNLCVHIMADENVMESIYKDMFKNGFQTLGRNEDLIRIDDVQFVEANEYEVDLMKYDLGSPGDNLIRSYRLKNNIYLNSDMYKNVRGIIYKINTYYTNDASKEKRRMNYVNVKYVQSGEDITNGKILLDDEGDIISFYK